MWGQSSGYTGASNGHVGTAFGVSRGHAELCWGIGASRGQPFWGHTSRYVCVIVGPWLACGSILGPCWDIEAIKGYALCWAYARGLEERLARISLQECHVRVSLRASQGTGRASMGHAGLWWAMLGPYWTIKRYSGARFALC